MPGYLRPSLSLLAAFSLLTGVLYPLVVTGVAQAAFPHQAGGSLLLRHDRVAGSELIGQHTRRPGDFWGRPSATSPQPCDAGASAGSNLGPSNPALREAIQQRIAELRAADPGNLAPIPVDLVTSSGSGLDPHLSPAAALFQASRVARARGLPEAQVRALVQRHTEGRTFGLLGEPRVNVLRLNLALGDLPRGP